MASTSTIEQESVPSTMDDQVADAAASRNVPVQLSMGPSSESSGALPRSVRPEPAQPQHAPPLSPQQSPGVQPMGDTPTAEIGTEAILATEGAADRQLTAPVDAATGSNENVAEQSPAVVQAPRRRSSLSSSILQTYMRSCVTTTVNEDGTETLTISVTVTKALVFLVAHVIVTLLLGTGSLFMQLWQLFTPTTCDPSKKMQQVLRENAHKASAQMSEAFADMHAEEDVRWRALLHIVGSCLDAGVRQFPSHWDRETVSQGPTDIIQQAGSSDSECNAALRSFLPNSTVSSTHQKRDQLRVAFNATNLQRVQPSIGFDPLVYGFIPCVLLLTMFLLLPWIIVFFPAIKVKWHRARTLKSLSFAHAIKRLRFSLWSTEESIKEKSEAEEDEKSDLVTDKDQDEGSATTSSGFQVASGSKLTQRHQPSKSLRREDIWTAAAQGATETVIDFRYKTEDFDINAIHPRHGPLLAAAARSGNLRLVQLILQWRPDLSVTGGLYHSMLQAGAHSGNLEVVRALLEAGARDHSSGGFYGTTVNAAAERGSLAMLQLLADYDDDMKAKINTPGGTHGYPLITAAFRGQADMVRGLISLGAYVDVANESNTSAIHAAAAGDHQQIVLELLEHEIDVSRVSKLYGTPLQAASSRGCENIALLMIEQGADVALADAQQHRTALHDAARQRLQRLASRILLAKECDVNATDADGNTALHHAAISGDASIVRHLIAAGANVSACDKFRAQALFRAAGCGHPEVVKILLEGKADPNARDCFGRTALHGPSETDDIDIHAALLKAGADVNIVGEDKKTALHEACNMGKPNLVKLLLAQPSVNVNLVDNDNQTALFRALCSNHSAYTDQCISAKVVEIMLGRPDIDVNLCQGLALQEACRKGMRHSLEKMLRDRQGNVHIEGGKYGGPVQAAAIGGHMDILELLLDSSWRANVNARGGEFGTPLCAALAYGHIDCARFLLDAGASVNVTGVGRYSSPVNSVCQMVSSSDQLEWRKQKDHLINLLGRYTTDDLATGIVEMTNLEDRWTLTTSGWTFHPKGDL